MMLKMKSIVRNNLSRKSQVFRIRVKRSLAKTRKKVSRKIRLNEGIFCLDITVKNLGDLK